MKNTIRKARKSLEFNSKSLPFYPCLVQTCRNCEALFVGIQHKKFVIVNGYCGALCSLFDRKE